MNLLQRIAGADQKILDECSDAAKNKITRFGALVLIPAVVGMLSMAYAVSTIANNAVMYGLAGVIWFFIVLFIESFIIATLYKSELNSKADFLMAVIVRYVFAIIVGVAVAHPMTLLWFNESITKGIEAEANAKTNNNYANHLNIEKSIRAGVDELNKTKACLEKLKTAEQSGHKVELECGYSSGLPGNSKRCEEIQRQIDSLAVNITRENERIAKLISINEAQLNDNKQSIEGGVSFDYLARVRMLSKLKAGEGGFHILLVHLFIMLFFIVIDILPITLKMATQYGEYEAVRDRIINRTIEMCKADRKDVTSNYIPVYVAASGTKLKLEANMSEVESVFNATDTTVRNIEKVRKKFQETTDNILKDGSTIKDPEVQKSHAVYFSSVLHIFNETVKKGLQKFLDYLKSV